MTSKIAQTYEQWDKTTTELQDKHGYTGRPKGHLAQVSIYEFVNDWVRPEISFKIFSYLGDPHKKDIQRSRKERRQYFPTEKRWLWATQYSGSLNSYRPRNRIRAWESQDEPHFQQPSPTDTTQVVRGYDTMEEWFALYKRHDRWGSGGLSLWKLKHTNPILFELWGLHMSHYTSYSQYKKWLISKNAIKKLLKENQVPGRTKLTEGEKAGVARGGDIDWRDPVPFLPNGRRTGNFKLPPFARREVIAALMKL